MSLKYFIRLTSVTPQLSKSCALFILQDRWLNLAIHVPLFLIAVSLSVSPPLINQGKEWEERGKFLLLFPRGLVGAIFHCLQICLTFLLFFIDAFLFFLSFAFVFTTVACHPSHSPFVVVYFIFYYLLLSSPCYCFISRFIL